MIITAADLPGRRAYRLLIDCVVPRPIAWITTIDAEGRINLAPFSFFQAVGADPPSIIVSIGKHRDGAFKDTGVNALAMNELVVNVVTDELAAAYIEMSADEAREAEADGPVRDRPRRARVHRQRPTLVPRR